MTNTRKYFLKRALISNSFSNLLLTMVIVQSNFESRFITNFLYTDIDTIYLSTT